MFARLFHNSSKPKSAVVRLRETMINGRCTFVGPAVEDVIDLPALEAREGNRDAKADEVTQRTSTTARFEARLFRPARRR